MNSTTYNGWTNHDTWNCNLWLTNDEITYRPLIKCKSINDIRDIVKTYMVTSDGKCVDDIDLSKVNFLEILESINEGK